MRHAIAGALRTLALIAAAAASAWAGAQESQYQTHLDAATKNAGSDPFFVGTLRKQWCFSAENTGFPPELQDTRLVPLTQVFDDVWYVGPRWVGQYIFRTDSGFFLLDTLNNAAEVQTITVPALQQLGWSASMPVLAAMPTHGHGDHHGGVQYLWETYGVPTYLGSADILLVRNTPRSPIPASVPLRPVDSTVLTPQTLTIAPDFQLTLLSTPGHTPGTLSGLVPVRQHGRKYKLAFWGGTAMPNTAALARQYLDGAERLYALSAAEGADGTLHTHPFADGSLQHIEQIAANGRWPNPFILGTPKTLRSLAILRQCAAAKVAQLDATSSIPVWRVTTLEFEPRSPSPISLAARVTSAWGPVVGQEVTFSVGHTGAACVAVTNADGVAHCSVRPRPLRPGKDKVTATFAGSAGPGYVDLASSASAEVVPPRHHRHGRDDD
jgi:glyoxylase-like metal-dependent hydrolase (beta-lactamase superfamily II)